MASKPEYKLVGLYEKLYLEKYRRKPTINRYRERWGMMDVIESIGYENAVECLVYYFKVDGSGHSHSLGFFFNHFDEIWDMMQKKRLDAAKRAELMEQTRKQVEGE